VIPRPQPTSRLRAVFSFEQLEKIMEWNHGDILELERLTGQGLTDKQIAQAMGRTHSSVTGNRWAIGLSKPKTFTEIEDRLILEMRKNGATYKNIALKLGRTARAVRGRARLLS